MIARQTAESCSVCFTRRPRFLWKRINSWLPSFKFHWQLCCEECDTGGRTIQSCSTNRHIFMAKNVYGKMDLLLRAWVVHQSGINTFADACFFLFWNMNRLLPFSCNTKKRLTETEWFQRRTIWLLLILYVFFVSKPTMIPMTRTVVLQTSRESSCSNAASGMHCYSC